MVFGVTHSLLLFSGDILTAYGMIGLTVTLLFLRTPTRRILVWLGAIVVMGPFLAGLSRFGPSALVQSEAGAPASGWSLGLLMAAYVLGLFGQTLLGVLMARAELPDRPWDHRRPLRWIAGFGVPAGLLGGLPYALTVGGYWTPGGTTSTLVAGLHVFTGAAAGAGYLACFGLWAAARRESPRLGAAAALAATGKRSLSFYLWQSLILSPPVGDGPWLR